MLMPKRIVVEAPTYHQRHCTSVWRHVGRGVFGKYHSVFGRRLIVWLSCACSPGDL